ncbi:MAG: tRNA-dihydrouridine synthase family protein [Bacteroidaceae bacterium]|nr:tRNA-dihydrouridine synthase family protein [Bacteroidaceae bacterium]
MKLYAAPLQGFTEAAWRNLHSEIFGGIDCYVTPFIRMEKGTIRSKDIRDIEKKNNSVQHLIPQLIAASPEEFVPLVEFIASQGYNEVDINMGCSFALQVRKCHGAGLLPHPDKIEVLMRATEKFPEISFSVKMRLGWESKDEWRNVLPILNGTKLSRITLHPRLGSEQYRVAADCEEFARFYEDCRHPLVYNGDLTTIEQMNKIAERFPRLEGMMMGRGLLADPALAREYKEQRVFSHGEKASLIAKFHQKFYDIMSPRLQGNTQFLSKFKPYWEYLLPDMEKRDRKAIQKASNVEKYLAAVNSALARY